MTRWDEPPRARRIRSRLTRWWATPLGRVHSGGLLQMSWPHAPRVVAVAFPIWAGVPENTLGLALNGGSASRRGARANATRWGAAPCSNGPEARPRPLRRRRAPHPQFTDKGGEERITPLHLETVERLAAWLPVPGVKDDSAGPLFPPPAHDDQGES
jgi:hypothetical protein